MKVERMMTVVDPIRREAYLDETVPVKPGGKLVVSLGRGSLDLRSHDADEVRIEAEARGRRAEQVHFSLTTTDRGVRFEAVTPPWWAMMFGGIGVRVRILVPRHYSVSVHLRGGEARVDGITGSLDLRTSGGDVFLSRLIGPVDVQTAGGTLEVEHVDGDMRLRSAGGATLVRDVFGAVKVDTAGGDLQLDGIDGPVEAKVAGGSASLVLLGDPEGDVRTSGGSCDVLVQPDASFELDARTQGSSVQLDLELENYRKDKSNGRVTGSRGEGGKRLKLRTSGGSVRVGLL
jgi:DUF4097 and DUF4098 domain-containing protein YvlB